MAAEYVLKEGNEKVMLCERGIRTFETSYRFTLDLLAVPVLKRAVAPAGRRRPEPRGRAARLVRPMSLAAAAAGADGIIVEVHNEPERGDLRRAAGAADGRASPSTPSRSGGSPRSPASELSAV